MTRTFVIGPPRSGTTLLKDILACHPALTVHGEDFHRFHHDLGRFPDHTGEHYRLSTVDAHAAIAAEYRAAVARACEASGREHFVLKISTLSIQVDYLRAIFPDARFIQLVRDGRDAACSMEDLRRTLGSARDLGPAPDPFGLWCAEQGLAPHVRAAASWFYHVTRSWLDLRFAGSDAVHRVRYEDLLRDPRVVVGGVLDFLGVPMCAGIEGVLADVSDASTGARLGFSTVQAAGPRVGRYARELSLPVRSVTAALLFQPMMLLGYEPDVPTARAALAGPLDVWQRRVDAETAWFATHVQAFSPDAMLRRVSEDTALRPLLVDGAAVGCALGTADGHYGSAVSWVQKQARRYSFADPLAEWPTVARRLDGRNRLGELSLSDALKREMYRLRDLGYLALV